MMWILVAILIVLFIPPRVIIEAIAVCILVCAAIVVVTILAVIGSILMAG